MVNLEAKKVMGSCYMVEYNYLFSITPVFMPFGGCVYGQLFSSEDLISPLDFAIIIPNKT